MKKIKVSARDFEVEAELLEEKRPKTCRKIWENLPFEGKVSIYKEEIYFDIPVEIEYEEATPKTEKGDVSYWPEGPAFCIFYGESQPVSSVNTFAKMGDDVEKFRRLDDGEKITVEKIG